MVAMSGTFIGPNDTTTSTPFPNPVEAFRHPFWASGGQRAGIVKGLAPSIVAGQMQANFTAGSAIAPERDASANELDRAYYIYADTTKTVTFTAAHATLSRIDSVIAVAVDPQFGATGSGGLAYGYHLAAVPGTAAGSPTAPSDSTINSYVGRGGWVRLYDWTIGPAVTQLTLGNAAFKTVNLYGWTSISPAPTLASGWTLASGGALKYRWLGPNYVHFRGIVNRSGSSITANTNGNFSPDVDVCAAGQIPAFLRPADAVYARQIQGYRQGVQTYWLRMVNDGSLILTHMNMNGDNMANGVDLHIDGAYILD